MTEYQTFVSIEISETLKALRGPTKQTIIQFLSQLESTPWLGGDFTR